MTAKVTAEGSLLFGIDLVNLNVPFVFTMTFFHPLYMAYVYGHISIWDSETTENLKLIPSLNFLCCNAVLWSVKFALPFPHLFLLSKYRSPIIVGRFKFGKVIYFDI